ncbi:MAG: TolC family protein, partial [Gammaproteobacteria bacterium]
MSLSNTIRRFFTAAFLSALSVAMSAAATSAPQFVHPFTLVELTDMALTNNPQTRLAWDALRASQAGVELARAGYWPQVSLTYSYSRNDLISFSGQGTGAQTRYGPAISLNYLLWDFGTRSGTLAAAKFALI